ncbi:MAG TPA: ATP synthase F1 subunit epsilon [Opitutales bacterium]|nr:ATP synthase F1 subunit epsilon [Opitutales bacterium]
MPLTLEIVTPERRVYRGSAESVIIPTAAGEIGILPGHVPLMTQVTAGELRLANPGPNTALPAGHADAAQPGPTRLAVDNGFARVLGDVVSIITEAAMDERKIDLQAAVDAQARAERALAEAREKKLDPAEIEQLEAIARFAIVQQLLKKKN